VKCMPSIKVYNDFMTETELNDAIKIIDNNHWSYGGISNTEKDDDTKFWHMNLNEVPHFSETIFKKIKESVSMEDLELERVYANGQTCGLDGSYHTDSIEDGHYTFMLYLSDINHNNVEAIQGHTEFKTNSRIISIEPIKNKGIFFKSDMLHRGLGPSRRSNILRVTVAYKMYRRSSR